MTLLYLKAVKSNRAHTQTSLEQLLCVLNHSLLWSFPC